MTYHLERLSRGSVDSRAEIFGNNLDEALESSVTALTEDSVEFARLLEVQSGDTGTGGGRIVAIYTAAEGWHKLEA